MKLSFENLGALDKGEIELADLTIVCGENNTGKTYVTYALYCLLKTWKRLINLHLTREFSELRQYGVVRIDAQEKLLINGLILASLFWRNFTARFLKCLHQRAIYSRVQSLIF